MDKSQSDRKQDRLHGEPVVRTPVELFAPIQEGESLVVQQGLGTGKSVYAMQETGGMPVQINLPVLDD